MADPLKLLFAGLFVAGLAGGVVYDPTPERPEIHRGGYRVLEADFHVHTTLSDGSLTPLGVVRQAERRGVDVIAITEHNTAIPGAIGRAWARWRGGSTPIVLQGEEVTSKRFHLIAVGIHETVSPSQPLDAVIAEIHLQRGIAIAAHPVKRYWSAYEPVRGALDGSELMHPLAFAGGLGWRWEDLRAFYERDQETLMPIGSSDYHWGSVLGLCRTYVFVDGAPTEERVMEALFARRTVVVDREGRAYGAPALTALVTAEPIPPRAADYRYRGEGTGDRVLRAAGFAGLVGLVCITRRRRPG
ncbi:MAG: hypothetical protein KIT84_29900 [Labilithrix sp.]|nr:hypothetical protein [Labilithrix sp.]MCW5815278.1 hypothetical protein [Labilithrix sp.]